MKYCCFIFQCKWLTWSKSKNSNYCWFYAQKRGCGIQYKGEELVLYPQFECPHFWEALTIHLHNKCTVPNHPFVSLRCCRQWIIKLGWNWDFSKCICNSEANCIQAHFQNVSLDLYCYLSYYGDLKLWR